MERNTEGDRDQEDQGAEGSEPGEGLTAVATALRAALAAGDTTALAELLAPTVTWGWCGGRDDVLSFLEQATAPESGVDPSRITMEAAADRLIATLALGDGDAVHHQAVFVADGQVTEICDAADRDDALRLRPVGPLRAAAARPSTVSSLAPVLPVAELDTAIAHYRALGFTVQPYEGGAAYAFVERDGIQLHLTQFAELDPAANTSAVYLYVKDADALFAQWRLAGVDGRIVAPTNTEYGLREGAHVDGDGNLLRFGSEMPT
jgi:hypothetical protein